MEILDELYLVHLQNLVLIPTALLQAIQSVTSYMVVNLCINLYYKSLCLFQSSTLSLECLLYFLYPKLLSGPFLSVECILKSHLFFKAFQCGYTAEPYAHEALPYLVQVLNCFGCMPCFSCVSYLEVLMLLIFISTHQFIISLYALPRQHTQTNEMFCVKYFLNCKIPCKYNNYYSPISIEL